MATIYDESKTYKVKLMRVARYRGVPLMPLPLHEMTGGALNEIIANEGEDVIDSANPKS